MKTTKVIITTQTQNFSECSENNMMYRLISLIDNSENFPVKVSGEIDNISYDLIFCDINECKMFVADTLKKIEAIREYCRFQYYIMKTDDVEGLESVLKNIKFIACHAEDKHIFGILSDCEEFCEKNIDIYI